MAPPTAESPLGVLHLMATRGTKRATKKKTPARKAKPKASKAPEPRRCKLKGCSAPVRETGGPGRRPAFCVEHRPQKNRARDLRRAAFTDPEAARQLASTGRAPESADSELSRLQRFAVFLGATGGDAEQAAELAGFNLERRALTAFAQRARDTQGDLIEAKLNGIASLFNQGMALLAIRLRDNVGTLPPNQVGANLKQLADVQQRLIGAVGPSWSSITVTASWLEDPPEDAPAAEGAA